MLKYMNFVFTVYFFSVIQHLLTKETGNNKDLSTTNFSAVFQINNGSNSKSFPNCAFIPVSKKIRKDLKQLLDVGVKLININLRFPNQTGSFPAGSDIHIHQLFEWKRTTGKHGQGLLFLNSGYRVLSLSTLDHGVTDMDVEIEEDPKGCIQSMNIKAIERSFRILLLNDFQEIGDDGSGGSLGQNEHVCNTHVRDINGHAHFFYLCCHKNDLGRIICADLVKDYWIFVLLLCIKVVYILILMFSPYLIPSSWYEEKHQKHIYQLNCPSPIHINAKLTPSGVALGTIDVPKGKLTEWKTFNCKFEKMDKNTEYELTISKVLFHVKASRLLPSNYAPVGISRSIYDTLFRCKIREKKHVKDCCYGSAFSCIENNNEGIEPSQIHFKWYKCLQTVMKMPFFLLFLSPYALRFAFFYAFENSEITIKKQIATHQQLNEPFQMTDSFFRLFKPTEPLFLFCHVILFMSILLIILSKTNSTFVELVKVVLRDSFQDMHAVSKTKAIGRTAGVMIYPFKRLGVFAFLVIPLYWAVVIPPLLLFMLYHFVPTLNITIRFIFQLLLNFPLKICNENCRRCVCFPTGYFNQCKLIKTSCKKYSVGSLSRMHKMLWFFVSLFGILALISFIIIAKECTLLFVHIVVYTLIGLILNASVTLKYVSLVFMLVLYGRDCFGSVTHKYITFNKAIHSTVLKKVQREVEKIAWLPVHEQPNMAFQIKVDNSDKDRNKIRLNKSNGILKWNIPYAALFLDKYDTPLITKAFFFKMAHLPHSGCPGNLFINLLKALRRFIAIILFLLFVLMVVKAFGEEYSVSGVNQMLATLAGGFLPWVFTNVLFKPPAELELDTKSFGFRNLFNEHIKDFKQNWPVADIVVDDIKAVSDSCEKRQDKNRDSSSETKPLIVNSSNGQTSVAVNIEIRGNNYEDSITED